jgi:RNA polymerase-interacting CarD/CdnL/TRCF family regulator
MLTFQPWGVVVPFTGVGIIEQLEYNFLTGHPALSVYFVKGGGRKYE